MLSTFQNVLGDISKLSERMPVKMAHILFSIYDDEGHSHSHYVDKIGVSHANFHRHYQNLVAIDFAVNDPERSAQGRGKTVMLTEKGRTFCKGIIEKLSAALK